MIILWRGTEDGLKEFLEEINSNKYHVSFSGGWNPKQTNFFDVEVYLQSDQIFTRTVLSSKRRTVMGVSPYTAAIIPGD